MTPSRRRWAIALLAGSGAAQLAVFDRFERRMRRTGGPGIIPFELAGTGRAVEILETWGEEGRAAARASLQLDFLFPPTYGLLQALACEAVADRCAARGQPRVAAVGRTVAAAQLAAAGFDYIENTALLFVLRGRIAAADLARRAALVKFALIGAGWTYVGLDIAVGRRR